MEKIEIVDVPIAVSRIGLGTWAMGGVQWGGTDDDESVRTIHAALDLGITLLDTADIYGDSGGSETILGEVLSDLVRAQDALDVAALVEDLVDAELQLRGILHAHAARDLALQESGVLPQRLQHDLFILAEQRLHERGRVAEVRRHAHLGHADEVRLERVIVHVAALQQLAQDVPHLLADAEQADTAAFGCFGTSQLE